MKTLLAIALVLAAFRVQGDASSHDPVQPMAPAHPALYSFADIYRLTVGGAALGGAPVPVPPDAPVRVAAQTVAPELQFSIVRMSDPPGWLLLLTGLALALWVGRRRLGYSLQ